LEPIFNKDVRPAQPSFFALH